MSSWPCEDGVVRLHMLVELVQSAEDIVGLRHGHTDDHSQFLQSAIETEEGVAPWSSSQEWTRLSVSGREATSPATCSLNRCTPYLVQRDSGTDEFMRTRMRGRGTYFARLKLLTLVEKMSFSWGHGGR